MTLYLKKLSFMDKFGVEMMILSLNAPAIQAIPNTKLAIETAQKSNDFLADEIHKRPDRFAGLAALPMQDTDAAIKELERCARELGFVGILVNYLPVLSVSTNFLDIVLFSNWILIYWHVLCLNKFVLLLSLGFLKLIETYPY